MANLRIVQGVTTVNGDAATSTIQLGIVEGTACALSLQGASVTSYTWVLGVPPGCSDQLSSLTVPSPTFTPTKAGNYFITLNGTYTLPINVTSTVPNVYEGPVVPSFLLPTQVPVPAQGVSLISDSTKPGSLLGTDANGNQMPVGFVRSGTTAQRPNGSTIGLYVGFPYFDTTLGITIWWNGTTWIIPESASSTVSDGAPGLVPAITTANRVLLSTNGMSSLWGQVDLATSEVTGTLPIARGGSGQTSFGIGTIQFDGSSLVSSPIIAGLQDTFLGYDVAQNSLCTGWLWHPEWRDWLDVSYTDASCPMVLNVATASNGRIDLLWLNPQKTFGSTVRSQKNFLFTCPPGITAVNFTVNDMRMPASVANNTIDLTVYDGASTASPISTQQFTLTQTLQNCTLSLTGLTPGHLYMAGVLYNKSSQQCNPYMGEITITPTNVGTGLFAGSFVRLRFNPSLAAGNLRQSYDSGIYFPLQTHFDIPFATNSSRMGVEVYQNVGGKLYYGSQGRWFLEGASLPNFNITVEDVAIPNPYATRRIMPVTVRTGENGGAVNQGNQVRAIYLEAGADYVWGALQSSKEAVIYSDSIGCGSSATIPALQGWPAFFRQRYPGRVIIEARPSRALFSDCATDSAIDTFSTLLVQNQPSLLITVIGLNDYLQNSWPTIADFKSAYASFVDRVHLKSPRTKIMGITPFRINTSAQGETPNANGIKLSDIRTAETQVLTDASRTSFCILVDGTGTTFYAITDLAGDNLHPTTIGQGIAGAAVTRQALLAGVL